MQERILNITRRQLGLLLSGAAAGVAIPGLAAAQGRKGVLVIGLDISDTVTFDPARQNNYSPPLTLEAVYDTLVTMTPGHYEDVAPLLATKWERTPDGKGWRFTLKEGIKFSNGNKVTPDDWKFSFDRILAIKDQTAQYIGNVASVAVSGPNTFDIVLKEPNEPLMGIIAAPGFAVLEKKEVQAHGGTDQPGADKSDTATEWLNQHSAGTGAYVLSGWARNQQIQLTANPNSWRGPSHYQRIVIRHIPDSAAQLLAVQRGDIDVAFNLIPEQIATLASDSKVRIESLTSLDFVYLAVTSNPELNKALAVKEARQAIGYAIDYDGLLTKMLGGKATRPAHFLPIGVRGSTDAIAKEIAFHQDLDKAKSLLQKAGLAEGFEFDLSYGNAAIAGISYQTLAQKIQSDLARVNIKAKLNPMDQVNLRTQYLGGKSQSVITFWNPPAVENKLWAAATVERVAKRVDFHPPPELVQLVNQAAAEQDKDKQSKLWVDYQKQMVDFANLIILFQPIYQVAVRNEVAAFPLTAAGWMADLGDAKPKA
jgi:peptide/nickel transport system substrate-binding protein